MGAQAHLRAGAQVRTVGASADHPDPPLGPMPNRLRSNADVRAALAGRGRGHATSVSVHARRRGDGAPRATVVAGKRVGTAPQRNRAKRRVRSALRRTGVPPGWDVVVLARRGAATIPFTGLVDDVASAVTAGTRRSRA